MERLKYTFGLKKKTPCSQTSVPPGKRNRKEHNLHFACRSPTNNLHTVPYIVLFNLLTMCLFPNPNIQYLTLGLCSVICVTLLFFTFSFFRCFSFGSHKPTLNLRHFSSFRFNILPVSSLGENCIQFNTTGDICLPTFILRLWVVPPSSIF